MRQRYYIIFVAREKDGRLRKIPVPLHYAYVFVAAAIVGLFSITGMAGSYSRMLLKTARFNEVRSQQAALRHDYLHMEQVAKEKDIQAASLGSLANQITALYGLRQNKVTKNALIASKGQAATAVIESADSTDSFSQQQYHPVAGSVLHFAGYSNVRPYVTGDQFFLWWTGQRRFAL